MLAGEIPENGPANGETRAKVKSALSATHSAEYILRRLYTANCQLSRGWLGNVAAGKLCRNADGVMAFIPQVIFCRFNDGFHSY